MPASIYYRKGGAWRNITNVCRLVDANAEMSGKPAESRLILTIRTVGVTTWYPEINGELIFAQEPKTVDEEFVPGLIHWRGIVDSVIRKDSGDVPQDKAELYEISATDVATIMKRRFFPLALSKAARLRQSLPKFHRETDWDGTFKPISNTNRVTLSKALDWALDLIQTNEAAQADQLPDISSERGGIDVPDLMVAPADNYDNIADTTFTASSAASGHAADKAADNDTGTYWKPTAPATAVYWQATFSTPQTVSRVYTVVPSGYTWKKAELRLINEANTIVYRETFVDLSGTTNMYFDPQPNIKKVQIREIAGAIAGAAANQALTRVSAYYEGIRKVRKDSSGIAIGAIYVADGRSYYDVIQDLCEHAGFTWRLDPGTWDGEDATDLSIRAFSLMRPRYGYIELSDSDDTIAPLGAGRSVVQVANLSVEEDGSEIINRVLVEYTESIDGKDYLRELVLPDGLKKAEWPVEYADARASQAEYGVRESRVQSLDTKTYNSALALGLRTLRLRLAPVISGSARILWDDITYTNGALKVTPGQRIMIHRTRHRPGTFTRSYFVAEALVETITPAWADAGAVTPLWADLSFGLDPEMSSRMALAGGKDNGVVNRTGRHQSAQHKTGSLALEPHDNTHLPWGSRGSTSVINSIYTDDYYSLVYSVPPIRQRTPALATLARTYDVDGPPNTSPSWRETIFGYGRDAVFIPSGSTISGGDLLELRDGAFLQPNALRFRLQDFVDYNSSDKPRPIRAAFSGFFEGDGAVTRGAMMVVAPTTDYRMGTANDRLITAAESRARYLLRTGGSTNLAGPSRTEFAVPTEAPYTVRVDYDFDWPLNTSGLPAEEIWMVWAPIAINGASTFSTADITVAPSAGDMVSAYDRRIAGDGYILRLRNDLPPARTLDVAPAFLVNIDPDVDSVSWDGIAPLSTWGISTSSPREDVGTSYLTVMWEPQSEAVTPTVGSGNQSGRVTVKLSNFVNGQKQVILPNFHPDSLVVNINGQPCTERNGRLSLLSVSGVEDQARGFDISNCQSSIRPNGLINRQISTRDTVSREVDMVTVSYILVGANE